MAQLKDTLIQGSARVTDTLYTTTAQLTNLLAPTTNNGATFGSGTNGQVLRSNGTSVYWATIGNASGYGVTDASNTRAITNSGIGLMTERAIYYGLPTINNAHNYTSGTTIYAPTTGGTTNTQALIGNGATAAPKWVDISPSSAWTAGTTGGPVLKITVLGQTQATGATIPSASTTASGVITTGDQSFAGTKTFINNVGIGTDNPSYKLHVNGSSYFSNTIVGDINSSWHILGGRPSNTTVFTTYFETNSNLHHDNPNRTDCEISYNRWFANNSDQTNYSPTALNLPVVDSHIVSFGIDNGAVYSRHLAFDIRTNAVFVRARNNNTWSNWEQLVRNTGTWEISISGNATSATTASKLGTSNFGSARQLFYLNAGTPTNGNYVVSHLGNAGKSNMNDVGRLHASMGMTNLTDPGNTVDNPGNNTGWHHYIDINYADDPNGSNSWVTQFANKAGTTDLWMRSRNGSTITNGTAWTAPWTRVLTESNVGQGLNTDNIIGLNLLPQTQDMQGWSGTENQTDTPFPWCYSHSAAKGSSSYADISWNSVVTPEPDTYYVLSYWAKASAATTINNFFYANTPQSGYNSDGKTTTLADGQITMNITTTWKRYWVVWKTRADVSGAKNIILARIQSDATIYIALPKLEKGQIATGWSPNPGDAYHIYGRTGNTRLIYNGGGGTAADQSLILHGNSTNGSSGIAFVSGKGNTAINYPSDRAFIQFHPYGVTTYTAEGTVPTLATSGEAATLVIGVGNDATDTIHLQTPGRTGLYHQVGASYYTIPDTNNTTGTVGSSSLPVYVNAGAITTVTAKDTCNAFINALDTNSSALTANDYVITQYVGGGTTTTTYHRKPASAVVNKALIDAALGASTTANFYRGDKTWSNTIKQTANAVLDIDSSTFKIGTARKDLNFDISNGSGTGVNDGYAGGITWGSGTTAYAGIYYQTSNNYGSRLIFATTTSYANGSYARMIIQNNGHVGIGTLSPDTLLTVAGPSKITGILDLKGDLNLYTSSTDSPDIVWWYTNKGKEQARIWMGSGGTTKFAPLYRCYNSEGASLYNGTLVLGDGTGASGTWGINISGNATGFISAKTITLTGDTTGSGSGGNGGNGWSIATTTKYLSVTSINTEEDIDQSKTAVYTGVGGNWTGTVSSMAYAAILHVGTEYSRSWEIWARRFNSNTNGVATDGIHWRPANNDATAWNADRMLLDTANYTNYTVTKTGGGASGTWGISISGNAATATKATQDGSGNTITNKYFQIYNTKYQGNSSTVTVNDLAAQGPAYGMIKAATDNPIGSATWVHVLNLAWEKTNASWVGQIALHTDGNTMYFRGDSSSAIAGKTWNTVLSSNNTAAASTSTISVNWNTETTIATINGTAVKIKIPANPNTNTDTLVKQTAKSDNVEYKLLATTSASPTSGNAAEAIYSTDIAINPSTHFLTITRANHSGLTGFVVDNTDSTNPLKIGYIIGSSGKGGIYDYTHSSWKVSIAANGTTTFNGNAATATHVAWDGITSKPAAAGSVNLPVYWTGSDFAVTAVSLYAFNGSLASEGWKTLQARTAGSKITVAYNTDPATWNSAKFSATLVYGSNDTKGMLDIAYKTPIVTFGGGASNTHSTDDAPKWYFKLSGTSGKTYTFPAGDKTLAATDGTGASGTWGISISGNAATATKATQDSDGSTINTTYIKKSIGTAAGDMIYWSAKSTPARLAKGTNGQVLAINSSGLPAWTTITTSVSLGTTTAKYYILGVQDQSTMPSSITAIKYRTAVYVDANAYLYATRVYNAVWNDYAEYRISDSIEMGRVYEENNNGCMTKTMKRLIPGCSIASDTFGSAMGETNNAKTPMAIAGRVLAYPYQDRENYHAGMAVCSAPDGTVDIMTRQEIMMYPDCIIGYVSEVPNYEYWGSGNVKVNNRIWIKIR